MGRDTRERILAAARDLVHAASLAEVSIDDVCRAAGVHKGSLYHFFPSKESLGGAVLDRNWSLVEAVLEEAFAPDLPPLARIDRFVDRFAGLLSLMRGRFGETPGCPLGGLVGELASHGAEARGRSAATLQRWARYFATAIGEAQDRGELDARVDPAAAGDTLLAHLQGLTLLAKVRDDPLLVLRAKGGFRLLLAEPD